MKAREIAEILKSKSVDPDIIRIMVELKEENIEINANLITMAQMIDKMTSVMQDFMDGAGSMVKMIQGRKVPEGSEDSGLVN